MNHGLHRIVFNRCRGVYMAVAECTPAPREGRSKGTVVSVLAVALAAGSLTGVPRVADAHQAPAARAPVVFASQAAAPRANLPQPYGTLRRPDGSSVNDPARLSFVANPAHAGRVRWEVSGNQAVLDQGDVDRVVLNWDSFDIGRGYSVEFRQNPDPTRQVSALNRIWSTDPSVILGALKANREVILVNANGVYFGRGSTVDTSRFVATTLGLTDATFEKGLRNVTDGSAVLAGKPDPAVDTARWLDSAVTVEDGALIRSAAGGDVLLVAPRVSNRGRIETPAGQAVLAAGERVYLMSSSDPAQRGLIVAVDPVREAGVADPSLGIVENSARGRTSVDDGTGRLVDRINEVRAEGGTVNLVGLTVRQAGQINATTAVKGANGTILLQAMSGTAALAGGPDPATPASQRGLRVEAGSTVRVASGGGTVQLASGSQTIVQPESTGKTQIDAEVFNPSRVTVEGANIRVEADARILAPGGRVDLLAADNRGASPLFNQGLQTAAAADGSRIVIEPGAEISVAGVQDVAVEGGRNQGQQRLFRIELADAPVQRDGPLYRADVYFDLRDGSRITAANVSGAAAGVRRSAEELSTRGGQLRVAAEGAVVVGQGAELDVSGGSVRYSAARIRNTVVQRDGRPIQFSRLAAGAAVDGLLPSTADVLSPAYVEGQSGGALLLDAHALALAGNLQGRVMVGDRQRAGLAPVPASATLQVGRSLGGVYTLAALDLIGTPSPPVAPEVLTGSAPVPAQATLSLSTVQQGGFGALVLQAGRIQQQDSTPSSLGPGGQLTMRAERIVLEGSFDAPGGNFDIATTRAEAASPTTGLGDIVLGSEVRLDTAGRWVNLQLPGAPSDAATTPIQGGSVRVSAAHSLRAEQGASVDVSGGARLAASGVLSRGTAGSVSLAVGRSELLQPELQLSSLALAGFDFSGGGRLSLGLPATRIGGSNATVETGFFSEGGFGSISVTAFGDITVASGAHLEPVLNNWVLNADYRRVAGGVMELAARSGVLDPTLVERRPVSLSLTASRPLNPGQGQQGGRVVVERGASVSLEPGATLSLAATRDIVVGASGGAAGQAAVLSAPGGNLQLTLLGTRGASSFASASEDAVGFLSDQAIWIGADAQLSVAGTSRLRPAATLPLGSTTEPSGGSGTVWGGGTLVLEAQRGHVVAQAGSRMNLDGASAVLDVPSAGGAATVAKAAGTLRVSSPEGFALEGQVSAQPPRDRAGHALADGGRIDLSVGLGGVNTFTTGPAYPGTRFDASGRPLPNPSLAPRELVVQADAGSPRVSGAAPGADLRALLGNGQGRVDAALLTGSGFDGLRLGAGDAVQLAGSWNAYFPLGVVLDAPAIVGQPGTQVALGGHYVSLGDRSLTRQGDAPDRSAAADTSPRADTSLRVAAPTVELVGSSGLRGFSKVELDAGGNPGGELRYSAVAPALTGIAGTGDGRLSFAGTLELSASQQYATTGSRFELAGVRARDDTDAGSRLVLKTGPGGAAEVAPLSVFGSLSMSATTISHGGVVRQPFGQVNLQAERSIELLSGSLTSVSGQGAAALFGATDNLSQWLQPSGVYADQLPLDKRISLSAAQVNTSPGAVVDASGGGRVLAWEFFAGVGGSRDPFAADGVFAVLPDHAAAPAVNPNGGVLALSQPGQQWVVTLPGSGLETGAYTVLPARYALLAGELPQGAYLVRRAPEGGRAPLAAAQRQDDGSVIVTGYLRDAGSAHAGTPGERWVVESPEVFRARGEVRLTSVDSLLEQRARAEARPLPILSRDAGRIEVRSTGAGGSQLQGTLDLAARGGRAGLLDLAGEQVAVVDDPARAPRGSLWIGADALSASGAGSVLLGGVRTETPRPDASTEVLVSTAGTRLVTLDSPSQPLQAEELLAAASERVVVTAGTTLRAPEAATLGPRTVWTRGEGALLLVGANAVTLQRSEAPASGSRSRVELGAGVRLDAPQVVMDASGTLVLDPTLRLDAQRLVLGAQRLVLGEQVSAGAGETVLSGAQWRAVQSASDLTLVGYAGIDAVGPLDGSKRGADGRPTQVLDRLVIDTPSLSGRADDQGRPASLDLAAHDLQLLSSAAGGVVSPTAPSAGSRLLLQALPLPQAGVTGGLTVGPGTLAFGFETASLRSSGDIVLAGTGGLAAAGDLSLSAARVTAGTGAQQALRAPGGRLQVQVEADSRTLGERAGQGAQVQLEARSLQQGGWLDLPGGVLDLSALGGSGQAEALALLPGSRTSVAGFALSGTRTGSASAQGHAGSLTLRAAEGSIRLAGVVDVSAAGRGDAGSLVISAAATQGGLELAPEARLQGRGGSDPEDRGGRLTVDVRALPDADALADAASQGGFDGGVAVRVRSGDLRLRSDLRARRISLSADAGALDIDEATLDARGTRTGGVVQLTAGADLRLGPTARVLAGSSEAGSSGGDVLLGTAEGRIRLAAGAAVDARGDDATDGRIVLRAPRGADNASVQVDALDTGRLQAGEVVIEGVRRWSEVVVGSERRAIGAIGAGNSIISGNGADRTGTLGQAQVRADNNAFMAAAPQILAGLAVGATDAPRVRLAPGVEVRAAGNLSLGADWSLDAAAERPAGEPGLLTLRAGGNLVFNGSLSDGFAGVAPTAALATAARSWSYRLVAGSDLSAADPLTTVAASTAVNGDVVINAGRLVRTGAGSIEVAAARDIRFGAGSGTTASGMLYVAGRRTSDLAAVQATLFGGQAARPQFTEGGGRVELSAGRDVIAPEATQLVNNWLWRSGLLSVRSGEEGLYDRASQLAWWGEFTRLRQTIGAFGGGGLRLRAGRDVINVQAMAPTTGWADSRVAADAVLQQRGGGDLEVEAGRNVLGGQYLVGRGLGRLVAGGGIGAAAANLGPTQPLLALQSGPGWRLSARDGLSLATAFNPTAVTASAADSRGPVSGFFYTWDGQSSLTLSANAGDVQLQGAPISAQLSRLGLLSGADASSYFRVLPAGLRVTAAGGDVRLLESESVGALLFPSTTGSLSIWSGGDLSLGNDANTPTFAQGDSALSLWPAWRAPSRASSALVAATLGDQLTRAALRAGAGGQVSLQAQGSIVSSRVATWLLAEPADIEAGDDVRNLRLVGQNLAEGDVTHVRAGRNLQAGSQGLIELGGPGWLDVSAGRNVDLGASEGIVTTGNQRSPNLAPQGASARVRAAGAGTLDLQVLRTRYLSSAADGSPRAESHRQALRDFVRASTGADVADFDAAWVLFQRMPADLQARFGRQVLAAEFRAVYLDGPPPTTASITTELSSAYSRLQQQLLQAGEQALSSGTSLELPGRERLQGDALRAYLDEIRALGFGQLDLQTTVQARLVSRTQVAQGWRDHVAASLGRTAAELDALAAARPADTLAVRWRDALASPQGPLLEAYQAQVLVAETASAAAAASQFGRRSLAMRLALFEQGFQAAELSGAGSFVPQPVWPGSGPLLAYRGSLDLTQSGIVTQRGGAIELVNPGGAINVGLKDAAGTSRSPKGVIALGGGNVFGYAKDDFQVNTQRVFIVGRGDMTVWSSRGDIDSGRGANTAVAAPPLAARRSVDGVVFEVPATTTGSGLGILEDAGGRRIGSIGLYPAFGEIVALDAFIRAPQVVLGATVKGADNLQASSVRGSGAPVAAPPATPVAPPAAVANSDGRAAETPAASAGEPRQRSGLLTVELLGVGDEPPCSEEDEKRKLCKRPVR